MRKAFTGLAVLLVLVVVAQFFLAATGAFSDAPKDESFKPHLALGWAVFFLPLLMTLVAWLAKLPGRFIGTVALISLLASLQVGIADDGALLWQVVCEYISASRKLVPLGYTRVQAWNDLRQLERLWKLLEPDWRVVERTETITVNYSLSIWDALLVAACLEGGVTRLYSEDITGYSKIDTLELVNPFATP